MHTHNKFATDIDVGDKFGKVSMDIETVSKIIESVANCLRCPMLKSCDSQHMSKYSCAKKWEEWLEQHKNDDFSFGIGAETFTRG